MNIKVIGIDLAKNTFQVCVQNEDNSIASNRKVSRTKLLHTLRQYPEGTLIAMEACGAASYWGRTFQDMGFAVKLLPAQHVKQLAGHQKNDANDAIAICEAAFRPKIRAVPVKTREQIDIKSLRVVRSRMVRERTALMNEIRAIAGEYGVIFTIGTKPLLKELPEALEDAGNDLTHVARSLLAGLLDDLKLLIADVDDIAEQIRELCQVHPRYKALLSIPGFGPLVAAAFLSEVGDGSQFKNGRHVSAWCGVIPKQHSSGGKAKLGEITKNGNRDLRTLLIHGARAVAICCTKRQDQMAQWFNQLAQRRGMNRAVVAMANKMARIGWRILTGEAEFELAQAFRAPESCPA